MAPDLNIIESGFARLTNTDRAIGVFTANALSAIKASWGRATSIEKRLGGAARHSISVYIMSVVAAAFDRNMLDTASVDTITTLMNHAISIDGDRKSPHVPTEEHDVGPSWEGPPGGPWKAKVPTDRRLELNYVPNMPGGHWSISIDGVPCLFGDDTEEVLIRTLTLLKVTEGTASQIANRFRTPNPFQRRS